jgi:prepilin-type N-terminal cleavage/methylation domain-containing protein
MNRRNKKGFTLIELLITVGLFVVIVTIAVGGFVNAIHTQQQVASLISSESNVSLALEQVAREVRTGYLFCIVPGNTQAVTGNNPNGADSDCSCVLSSSIDSSAPPGSWTCKSLDFYDAAGSHIVYSSPQGSGALMEKIGLGTAQSITGDGVSVKYLQFQLFGQVEGDHWPARVTISLGIAPSSTDPAIENDVFNLQTTVSSRDIDCVPGTQQC